MVDPTVNTNAEIASADRSSILCDGQLLATVIAEFGQDVIVKETNRTDTLDPYDEGNISYVEHRTRAFVSMYSESDDDVKEGIFKAGTVNLTFSASDVYFVKTNNKVWFDQKWWEIASVSTIYSGTSKFTIQATVKRMGPIQY